LKLVSLVAAALLLCARGEVCAQTAEDTRTQYPALLQNSYISINVGAIGDAIYNEASDAVDAVGDAGKWVGNEAEDAAGAIGDAASSVGDAICDVFDW